MVGVTKNLLLNIQLYTRKSILKKLKAVKIQRKKEVSLSVE